MAEYIVGIADDRAKDIDRLYREYAVNGMIVRCGDCKYFNNHPMTHGLHYGECDNGIGMVNHDWFCADGERKDDG